MFRNRKKNSSISGSTSSGQYGTFIISNSGNKKTARILITAALAVIFVFGIGVALFNKNKKPTQHAILETAASDPIPGWWYQQYFASSVCDKDVCKPDADPDKDGLSNAQEFYYHTDPLKAFTVKDKLNDGQLVAAGFDPSKKGHVTFAQAVSQDSILGESLVFNSDIQDLINQSVNPNNVPLPQINELELNIIKDNSRDSAAKYLTDSQQVYDQNFPKDRNQFINDVIASGNSGAIGDLQKRLINTANELKQIQVPPDFLLFHKYTIAFLQLLPSVIDEPSQDQLANEYDPVGNKWYDQTQQAMTLYQKITLESNRLGEKYP